MASLIRLLIVVILVTLAAPGRASSPGVLAEDEVRFGITGVVVTDNLAFFDNWGRYLSQRIGRPVHFVRRRTYREIMEMLVGGEIAFAWICGYPFVQSRWRGSLDLLSVPVFEGQPTYRSYIIVGRDSRARRLEDLQGQVFAFSDPDSNSGYLVPRTLLRRRGVTPERFFRLTFFTYSHAETVEAVADGVADAGAVDSYVWEYLARQRPTLTRRTQVIYRSAFFGFPPIVARKGAPAALVAKMAAALHGMANTAEGRNLLAELALDRFGPARAELFDSIAVLARALAPTPMAKGVP